VTTRDAERLARRPMEVSEKLLSIGARTVPGKP